MNFKVEVQLWLLTIARASLVQVKTFSKNEHWSPTFEDVFSDLYTASQCMLALSRAELIPALRRSSQLVPYSKITNFIFEEKGIHYINQRRSKAYEDALERLNIDSNDDASPRSQTNCIGAAQLLSPFSASELQCVDGIYCKAIVKYLTRKLECAPEQQDAMLAKCTILG